MPQEEEKTTRQVSLKNLEPIYRKFVECFDFNVADLVNAMTRSIDVFYPESIEEKRVYSNPENRDDYIIEQRYPKLEDFFFQENKHIALRFPSCEALEKVNNFIKKHEFDPVTATALWVMFYIYGECERTPELTYPFDWNYENIDWNYYNYKTKIEPDFLRLYHFIKRLEREKEKMKKEEEKRMLLQQQKDKNTKEEAEEQQEQNETIRITFNKTSIKLDNHSNWFWIHLKEYLENHLEKEAKKNITEKLKNLKGKAGAKEDRDTNRIIYQLYTFLKDHPKFKSGKRISNSICEFIMEALEVIPRPEPFPEFYIPVSTETMRTRIFDLTKEDGKGKSIRSKRNENLNSRNIKISTDFIPKSYW